MTMNGTNLWNGDEDGNAPQFVFRRGAGPAVCRYILGSIRWASIQRGSNLYTGWVLCYPDGKPITYADASQPGSISVSASGSYMTL